MRLPVAAGKREVTRCSEPAADRDRAVPVAGGKLIENRAVPSAPGRPCVGGVVVRWWSGIGENGMSRLAVEFTELEVYQEAVLLHHRTNLP